MRASEIGRLSHDPILSNFTNIFETDGRIVYRELIYPAALVDRSASIPEFKRAPHLNFSTEQVQDFSYTFEQKKKRHAAYYDLEGFINLNSFIKVSLEEWLDFDPLTRASITDIINKRIQEQNAKVRDHEEKLKLDMAHEASKVKLPFDAPSSINRIMNM